ncbi:MAG: hypothetical protein U9N36_04230 [Euryarchaeota archaeon]|nr:hypothetical protein [Euryarchaeota archaeon]
MSRPERIDPAALHNWMSNDLFEHCSRISGKITTEEIISTLKWSISFYFRWILPLLFVAAVIETFITPAGIGILGC